MTDLGKEIKERRLLRGISLKEISESTRIDLKYLEKIENNEFDFLPPLYVKSFLKSYLLILDVDSTEYLKRVDELLKGKTIEEETVPSESDAIEFVPEKTLDVESFLKSKTTVLVLVSLILLIFVIILIVPGKHVENEYVEEKDNGTISRFNEKKPSQVIDEKKESKIVFSKDSLTLVGIASDSVWMQIKGDGTVIDEIFMRKGEQKYWRAKENFEVLIGNAGAISFALNKENLPFVGMPGAVKRVYIDPEGLKIVQQANESKNQ